MSSSRWLSALLTLFVSLPCVAQEWQPLRQGLRWTYETSGVDTVTIAGTTQTVQVEGTRKVLVGRPSSELPGSPYEIIETRTTRTQGFGTTHTTVRAWGRSSERGFLAFGEEFEDPFSGAQRLVRYEPPLRYLPANPRVGQKWHVGAVQADGLRFKLDGEIVGIRDVKTPTGLHRGCLEVRYTGPISGSFASPVGPVPILNGTTTMTSFYAKGIGAVREEEDFGMTMRMPDGMHVRATTRVEHLLQSSNLLDAPARPEKGDPHPGFRPRGRAGQ